MIVGLSLVLITGWLPWDPIAAIVVSLNILVSGVNLMRQSVGGLMDTADPAIHKRIVELLDQETAIRNITYHDLRHRNLGNVYWVEVHLLFPESVPIGDAHRIATEIEAAVSAQIASDSYVTTHLEAIEDHQLVHAHGMH